MDCQDAQLLISLSLDGEITENDRKRLDEHVAGCAGCRARVDRWRRIDAIVREGLRAAEAPAGLADRILSRVEVPRKGRIRWGRWVASVAAVAVALFGVADGILRHQITTTPAFPEQDVLLMSSAEAASGGRTRAIVRLVALREGIGVAGVKVTLAMRRPGEKNETTLAEGTTREDGLCPLPVTIPPEAEGDYEMVARVLGPKGEEEVKRRITVKRDFKLFVTTDKPLYQPSQVIEMRALVLSAADLAPVQGLPVLVEVFDSRDNKVYKRSFPTSKFGIISTRFELADEVLTGMYRVKATAGNTSSEARVEVKRYVLPKFRVTIDTERSWYLPGETVKGTVRANYFFGKTVERGKVDLEYFTFAAEEVKLGAWEGKTDGSGTARFELALPAVFHGIDLLRGDAPLLLRVKVTDAADHPQEASASLTVSRDPIRIVLVPESGRLVPNVENILYVLTTYPDGRPAQCQVTLDSTGVVLRADDGATSGPSIAVTTDDTGLACVRMTPQEGKAVLASVRARDAAGNQTTLKGDTLTEALGALDAVDGFLLRPDRAIYKAGETMKLAVLSPAMPGSYFVDLVRENRTLHTATVEVKDGVGNVEIDLPPEAFGAIQVHAYRVMPSGQIVRDTRVVLVDPPAGLSMTATLDKETYRPGDKARIEFRVTNSAGAGVPSAIGLSIVDESLFALAETRPGLERVYAAIEEDILKPRYQIKSLAYTPVTFAVPEARPRATEPRIQALATVSLAAAGVGLEASGVERSFHVRERELDQRRRVLQSRLKDLEKFGEVVAGLLVFVVFPVIVIRKLLRGAVVPTTAVAVTMVALLAGLVAGPSLGFRVFCAGGILFVWLYAMLMGVMNRAYPAACALALGLALFAFCGPFGGLVAARKGSTRYRAMEDVTTLASVQPAQAELSRWRRADPPRLRQWFPETLFWAPQVITDETGRAVVDVPNVADSITTWRIVASAVSARGEMGGMTDDLRVFQDFFVDPDLPLALTQGDRVDLPVAVYNWLTEPQDVELALAASEGFTLLDGEPRKTVRMEGNSVGVVRFPIRVERIGAWTVRVDARGSKGLADAIQRVVQVLPDGKEVPYGASDRLSATARQTVTIPRNAIDGASVLLVKLLPGSFAEMKDGLEGMLRMPYG